MALTLEDKLSGALYGGAIGDGMGAPVEGWTAEKIAARFGKHSFAVFLPPTHGGEPQKGKGDGRVTDDTLLVEALIRAYAKHKDHLDAYGYEQFLLPEIAQTRVFIPEWQNDGEILYRLWWPEKYPWIRMTVNNVEPRAAGRGNCVNCGVAMWMMPVGAVNAGDPPAAYAEAASLALAHNESYALEAGAVTAAAFAAAFTKSAQIPSVLKAALDTARDGTRAALESVLGATRCADTQRRFIAKTRHAFLPYDSRAAHAADDQPDISKNAGDTQRPSRVKSIEETPIALAALKYGDGDFAKTLRAAVCYGRDCDSIAGLACGFFGALYGAEALPARLREDSDRANRRDWRAAAFAFAQTVRQIHAKDRARFLAREREFPE